MNSDTDAEGLGDTSNERIATYVERNPNATVAEVLGRFVLDPSEHSNHVDAILGEEDGNGDEASNEDGAEDGDADVEDATEGDGASVTADGIRKHYRRARPVYQALNDVCGNPTVAKCGDYGLYTTRQNDDPETLEDWPWVGRPRTFDRDFEKLIDGAAEGAGTGEQRQRAFYAHTSYNDAESLRRWHRNRDADSKNEKWDIDSPNPMPGCSETRAIAAWGGHRPRGRRESPAA